MLDAIKPGQKIRCTITRDVRVEDAQSTIERLMRFDPAVKRRLKAAQEFRMKNLKVVSRGRRPWECRVRSARYAVASKGAVWTMTYFPQVANDFKSVGTYLKVEAA